jgi:hypothetical protein
MKSTLNRLLKIAHLEFGRRRTLGVARRIVSDTLRTAPKDSCLSQREINLITSVLADDVEQKLKEGSKDR